MASVTEVSPRVQEALAEHLRAADERGVRFVLSNSFTPLVRSLYQPFRVYRVPAKRAINSNGARRGPVDEAVVVNCPPAGDGVSPLPLEAG